MRLIDADAVLEHFAEYWAMMKKLKRPSKQQHAQYMTMRLIVNSLKTEDAVPVIRCKECKYGSPNGVYGCRLNAFGADLDERMYSDDYCSMAERKEE